MKFFGATFGIGGALPPFPPPLATRLLTNQSIQHKHKV